MKVSWLLQNRRYTALEVFSLFESFAGKGGFVLIASGLPPSLLLEWCPPNAKMQDLTPKHLLW